MGFDNVASRHLGATDAAVVRTLRGGVANFGPTVGTAVLEEGVLLLDTKPGLKLAVLLFGGHSRGASVGGVRGVVGVQYFAHHQDVVRTAQWVRTGEDGIEDAVRRRAVGLVGA